MILVAPYSTDAPLYHYPIVTVSMMVANVVIYFATTFQVMIGNLEFEQIEWLMIQFNQINPIQWLTGNFMHFGFMHLLGNLLFLFAFGLVVEGKVGNLSFLGIYLASAVLLGAVVQIPMFFLGGEGLAGGASGVISTLMIVALFWAPENEISLFYWVFIIFAGTFEVQIMTLCIFFIGMDLLSVILSGFAMSGAMGHVIGAILGAPIALHYLRNAKVDCEGWDIVSRNDWLKDYSLFYSKTQRQKDNEGEAEIHDPVAAALAVAGGDVAKSKLIGLPRVAPPPKRQRAAVAQPKPAAKRGGKQSRKKKRSSDEPTAKQIAARCQAHPEFNRLAFLLRQHLQSKDVSAAHQTFLRLDALKLGCGLAEPTLMSYVTELTRHKQWVNSIRPLAVLIEKRGSMAEDACLRLAQIQLKILKRPDLATKTLDKISPAQDGISPDAAKQQRLKKKAEMLSLASQQII